MTLMVEESLNKPAVNLRPQHRFDGHSTIALTCVIVHATAHYDSCNCEGSLTHSAVGAVAGFFSGFLELQWRLTRSIIECVILAGS